MASPVLAALSRAPARNRHLPLISPINTLHKHSAVEALGSRERRGKEKKG